MGLDIRTKNQSYSRSYAGLHFIRHLAYICAGGNKEYADFMYRPDAMFTLRERNYDDDEIYVYSRYRELFWHSDCEGSYGYTRSSIAKLNKIDEDFLIGNLPTLVNELKEIERLFTNEIKEKHIRAVEYFYEFKNVAEDALANRQKLIFT